MDNEQSIDRGAQAAYDSVKDMLEPHPPTWSDLPGWTRDQWRAAARAVMNDTTKDHPMNDNYVTAELTISWSDGTYSSYSATRGTEREAIVDLWRMIAHAVEHATGTARPSVNTTGKRDE